jgi:hypothetical protein
VSLKYYPVSKRVTRSERTIAFIIVIYIYISNIQNWCSLVNHYVRSFSNSWKDYIKKLQWNICRLMTSLFQVKDSIFFRVFRSVAWCRRVVSDCISYFPFKKQSLYRVVNVIITHLIKEQPGVAIEGTHIDWQSFLSVYFHSISDIFHYTMSFGRLVFSLGFLLFNTENAPLSLVVSCRPESSDGR